MFYTLVADGAIPAGYLVDLPGLEIPALREAMRQRILSLSNSDPDAEMRLLAYRRDISQKASTTSKIMDQLVMAADLKPGRFRTKWQQAVYEGPTARKDAESAERERWFALLADLLTSTDTPMGEIDS